MAPGKRELKAKKKAAKEEVVVKKKRRRKWRMPNLPDNAATFLYDTGVVLKTRGDFDLAIQVFDTALKMNPNKRVLGKILLGRGECKSQIGQYFASLFGVNKAKRNEAWSSDCLFNEARIMYELCEYEDAMTKFYQGSLAHPNDARFKAGVYQCRQTIQECIGDQAGPVLVDMLRWIRIVEDRRQRILSGTSYGASPGQENALRPISRTILATFVASGDISPSRVGGEEGVVLESKSDDGSGTVLPDQEEVNVIRKGIHSMMTRHYLGRLAGDYKFLEKLVAATSRVDETIPEQDYGFWSAQEPAAALMSPANRKGSFSMLSRVRDMLALIKSLRESLRCREPYHSLMIRAKSYVERDKRREMERRKRMGEQLKDDMGRSHNIPWAKLEQARQKAWFQLEAARTALKNRDTAKCLACGERARDLVETLPPQAFALGRKETMYSGKSGYVRAIAREIGRAYLKKRILSPSLTEEQERQKLLGYLGQWRRTSTALSNEMIADSNFPFRDPYHLINRIEKWLKITSNEPKGIIKKADPLDDGAANPCEIYEHSGPQVHFQGPSCGGELEKAWLFHEMGRCRVETGHTELARRWSRRAVAAARRALAQDSLLTDDEEDEWGGTNKSNQDGAAVWLVNAFLLTARVEAVAGSLENAESAMMNAAEELAKRLPEEKEAQEWIRFVMKSIKWLSRELTATKSRLKRGSFVHSSYLLKIAATTGLPAATLQHFLGPSWSSQRNRGKE